MKQISSIYKRILKLLAVIFLFIAFGSVGFMYSENMNLLDAIWFSTMTLTTVGFGVPDDFTNIGKIISIFLMIFGVGTVLYGLTALAIEFFSGALYENFKQRKLTKKVEQLNNHIIICGFGRNGRQAARKLMQHKKPFLIIDRKEIERRQDEFDDTIFLRGNAVEDEVLKRAGVERASGLIAALPSDADNLFIVISAKEINPNLKIISRASNSNSISKLKTAGAENVIMPDKIGGEHMASLLVTPDLVEFMDNITLEGTKSINLLEIHTNSLDENYLNKPLKNMQIREQSNCSIIGYKNKQGKYIINPDEDIILEKDCNIIVLGRPEQIKKLKNLLA